MKGIVALGLAGSLLLSSNLAAPSLESIVATASPKAAATTAESHVAATTAEPQDYSSLLRNIEQRQAAFREAYTAASGEEKEGILENARSYLFNTLTQDIFPAWYGTPWDFNGVTQEPGKGAIACGYFVTTTLRDAGFDLQRVRLAQQPASLIIKNLAEKDSIKQFSNASVEEFSAEIESQGPGIYIVGLDCHIGFVVNNGKNLRFTHSNYYDPKNGVVSEPLNGNNPLANSRYRVSGKILGDAMVERWVRGAKLPMPYQYRR